MLRISKQLICLLCILLSSACVTVPEVAESNLEANGRVFNAENGTEVSASTLVSTLSRQRHVYVGERHREPLSHRTQLDILELLHRAEVPSAIAIEWLPVTAAQGLERYVSGEITETEMLQAVGWKRYWGHNFGAYRAIFNFARENKIPIWPLNAPRGIAAKIARGQIESFTDEERQWLTSLRTGTDAHRAYFFKLMAQVSHAHGHGHGHHRRAPNLDNYYQAQLYRDEFMAKSLAERLEKDDAGRLAVVFAGRAHVAYGLGIPQRAAQLGFPGFTIVLPVPGLFPEDARRHFGKSIYPEKRSDFLWYPRRGGQ